MLWRGLLSSAPSGSSSNSSIGSTTSARASDSLLLAAGELRRQPRAVTRQLDQLKGARLPRGCGSTLDAACLEPEGDVLGDMNAMTRPVTGSNSQASGLRNSALIAPAPPTGDRDPHRHDVDREHDGDQHARHRRAEWPVVDDEDLLAGQHGEHLLTGAAEKGRGYERPCGQR